LRIASEAIKERLSANIYVKLSTEENVDVENITAMRNIPSFYKGKSYKISLSKAEYDKYTNDLYIDHDVQYKKFILAYGNKSMQK